MPPDGSLVEGHEAIIAHWTGFIEGPGTITLDMIDVDMLGDAAVETGTWSFVVANDEGGEDTFTGKTFVLWKKDGDGTWRMAQDMWNNDE